MIRSQRAGAGPPRMILTRAALDCDSIDAAAALIAGAPRAGAFHLSLAQAGDSRLVSLEFTHSGCSTLAVAQPQCHATRSEEHTSELPSLMRISYAVFCLKKKKQKHQENTTKIH